MYYTAVSIANQEWKRCIVNSQVGNTFESIMKSAWVLRVALRYPAGKYKSNQILNPKPQPIQVPSLPHPPLFSLPTRRISNHAYASRSVRIWIISQSPQKATSSHLLEETAVAGEDGDREKVKKKIGIQSDNRPNFRTVEIESVLSERHKKTTAKCCRRIDDERERRREPQEKVGKLKYCLTS